MKVVYEDNHLLAVIKPAGVLTQDSGRDEVSLEDEAKAWIKEKAEKPGNVFLHAIHRLDRPVSGIVVFAKTSKALSRLHEAIRNKQVTRKYLALVEGGPKESEGTLRHYLSHDKHQAISSIEGKECVLNYRATKRFPEHTLLDIQLETGRYHQIRAQTSLSGFPIVGDLRYGAKTHWDGPGIALHHFQFQFTHPTTKEQITLFGPFPQEGWGKWQEHLPKA